MQKQKIFTLKQNLGAKQWACNCPQNLKEKRF